MQKNFCMKKAIGIGLLLLANIVLLVHAVIPHHHHNLLLNSCTISFHQYDAIQHCQHLQDKNIVPENDENTHRNLSLEDCLLDNVYIRFVNDNHSIQGNESNIDFQPLFLLSDNSIRIESDFTPLPFRQKPHSESLYTSHITQSKGLRAPPFC